MIKDGDILVSRLKLVQAIEKLGRIRQFYQAIISPKIEWDWITTREYINGNRN